MSHPMYKTARWKRLRALILAREPLCRMCKALGITSPSDVVDHIVPHRGDDRLAWDEANLQGVCTPCHAGPKQSFERTGAMRGCDVDGTPAGRAW